jgi:Spy/CpxP family protein refolding chaperone
MRTFGIMALTLGAAVLIAAPVQAQGFRGRGMGGGGGYMLLSNKSVQQELKLEGDQAEKVSKIVTDIGAKFREKIQDIPQDERREKMPELMRASNEEAKSALKGELKPEQTTRLEQIIRQQQGVQAFADPTTAEKLKLTADQKAKIQEINQESGEKMREIFSSAGDDRAAAMEKMQTLRKESFKKAHAALTDDQKKSWKELTGEPFEVKFERRPNN